MLQLLLLLLRALLTGLGSRRDLALENLVLRHQLHVVLRTNPNPGLRNRDRVLWRLRWFARLRLYWSWKSRTLGRSQSPGLGSSPDPREPAPPVASRTSGWRLVSSADTGGGSRRGPGARAGGPSSRMSSRASGQPISWSSTPLTTGSCTSSSSSVTTAVS